MIALIRLVPQAKIIATDASILIMMGGLTLMTNSRRMASNGKILMVMAMETITYGQSPTSKMKMMSKKSSSCATKEAMHSQQYRMNGVIKTVMVTAIISVMISL